MSVVDYPFPVSCVDKRRGPEQACNRQVARCNNQLPEDRRPTRRILNYRAHSSLLEPPCGNRPSDNVLQNEAGGMTPRAAAMLRLTMHDRLLWYAITEPWRCRLPLRRREMLH